MKKRAFYLLAVLINCVIIEGFSQTGVSGPVNIYSSATIPADLKKGAHSVKRKEEIEVEITQPGKATYKVHTVETILDSKGLHNLFFTIYTNSFNYLEDVELKLFDSVGKVISKTKRKDLSTTIAGEGLVPDYKVLYTDLSNVKLPVTLETNLVITKKGVFSIPEYVPQTPDVSVEQSSYTIRYVPDIGVKFKAYNFDIKAEQKNDERYASYTFNTRPLAARKYEENSGPWQNYYPRVVFNAAKFEYGGYQGNMADWKEFGLWFVRAYKNVNQLSEPHKQEIRAMVAGAKTDREKVKILYENLQKNFRYVSIQLGIGGLIPFPADFLHEKKYGDCKGLSSYMQSCLSVLNIKSHVAIINAGQDEAAVDPSFPANGFNHVILCAILAKDTLWLECTSNYNDFGHLGNFTENRNALLVTDAGGFLVRTPSSKPDENTFVMKTKVAISEDGSGEIEADQRTTGEYKYTQVNLAKEKSDDQKLYMVNRLGFANPDDYSISYGDKSSSPYSTRYKLLVEKISDFNAGSKMFIKPRMYKFWGVKMPTSEKRTQDFLFECPLKKIDTTIFILPEGFSVDALPVSKKVEFEFGKYESKYWVDAESKQIFSTANLVLTQYRIPADKYAATKAFMDKILEDENQKLVIRKQ
jgi:hypothetical protein